MVGSGNSAIVWRCRQQLLRWCGRLWLGCCHLELITLVSNSPLRGRLCFPLPQRVISECLLIVSVRATTTMNKSKIGGSKQLVTGTMNRKNSETVLPSSSTTTQNTSTKPSERLKAFLNAAPAYKINRSCSYYKRRQSLGKVSPNESSTTIRAAKAARSERMHSLPLTMPMVSEVAEEVVRQFKLTDAGTLQNIGDTRRRSLRKSSVISVSGGGLLDSTKPTERIEAETIETGDGIVNEINVNHACIVGMKGTGKKSILKQFRCSEYNGIYRFDNPPEKFNPNETIPVLLENVESRIQFFIVDIPITRSAQEICLPEVNAYLLVYDVTRIESFDAVVEILHRLSHNDIVIIIGNKSDLMRKRVVTLKEAKKIARIFYAKHVEVSVALNQNIDSLLAGTVKQIRLAEQRSVDEKTKNIMERKASIAESQSSTRHRSFLMASFLRLFACGIRRRRSKAQVSNLFVDSHSKKPAAKK